MPSGRADSGYTMIELIVVLVLVSIMLALGAPKIHQSLLTNNLKTTTRRLIGLVKNTRDQAIRQQQVYYLRVDLAANRVTVDSATGAEREGDGAGQGLEIPEDVTILDIWRQGSGTTAEGEAMLRFSEKGYVEPSVIHLEGEDGTQVSLELSPFLSTIRIHDRYLEKAE